MMETPGRKGLKRKTNVKHYYTYIRQIVNSAEAISKANCDYVVGKVKCRNAGNLKQYFMIRLISTTIVKMLQLKLLKLYWSSTNR